MRSLIYLLGVALCLTAFATPASAGLRDRRQNDNSQAAGGQCDGANCARGECKLRKKIDVDVNVTPAAVAVQPSPVQVAMTPPPASKSANKAEEAGWLGLIFLVTVLSVGAYLFHQRVAANTQG
jgi:hypothetical protein